MATKFNRFQVGNAFTVPAGTKIKTNGSTRIQQATRRVTATGIRSTRTKSGSLVTEILWKSNGYLAAAVV